MTVSDQRQDDSTRGGDSRQVLPGWLRIVGGIVILATAIVVIVAAMWLLAPELVTQSRRTEGLIVRILVASLTVAGAGGLFMGAVTKNPGWLLPLFVAIGVTTLWFVIFGAMGALMH